MATRMALPASLRSSPAPTSIASVRVGEQSPLMRARERDAATLLAPSGRPARHPRVMADVLNAMSVFVAVIEAGGFRAASTRLGVTASAVSQTLRRLEE